MPYQYDHELPQALLDRISAEQDRYSELLVHEHLQPRKPRSNVWGYVLLFAVVAGLTFLLLMLAAARTKGHA